MSDTPSPAPAAAQFLAQRELYRSRRTLVELGTWQGQQVVAKRSAGAATAASKSRALHEFQMLSQACCPWVVNALALDERDGVLLLEHVQGGALSDLSEPLSLPEFYTVAHDVCRALATVHEALLIHKNVSPANLVRTHDGRTKLLDFDIAARASWDSEEFRAPSQIEGTLAYIAPEQTGRTSRTLDHRGDLYSLGATFHYLLSGRPPFEARDPLELIHRHLAAPPPSLSSVPPALAAIVQKLLAKNAEDRYQSALGVLRDLERSQDGRLSTLASDDVSHRLTLPARLIGREREIATVQGAFQDMLEGGRAGVALIAGSSGVGKTALVRELRRLLIGTRGYYLHGKFDAYRRDMPYSAIESALSLHVQVLLGAPADELSALRTRLHETLGSEAGALVSLFPALLPLLGSAATPASLSAREQQGQSERLIARLLLALASRVEPLLFFLDDLQWADRASLAFLERFARVGRFALLIGAYRDDALEQGHPLREQLAHLAPFVRAHVSLKPLDAEQTLAFTQETLRVSAELLMPLAAVLHKRSGGSPFFLGQALLALYHAGVLRMRDGRWSWDEARIDSFAPSEQVVDISAMRLARAPGLTRELLCWAACLGSEFELTELSALTALPAAASEQALERAANEGFLTLRAAGRYAFLHDRVRQAAYADRSEVERRAMHRHIALSWLEQGREQERLFELVAHLTSAVDLNTAQSELPLSLRAAQLNLAAARRAQAAGAFDAAVGYAQTCRALLRATNESASDDYRKATLIYGEAQYSRGRYLEAHHGYDELLKDERDPVERATLYRQKAVAKAVEGRIEEAFALFSALARELGFDFNTAPSAAEAAGLVAWAHESLLEFGCEQLRALPACEAANSSALIEACAYFGSVAYATRPALFKALQSYTLIHCFDQGVSVSAPPMITAWATCAASLGDYPLALEVATAGCLLAEKYSPAKIVARAQTLFALLAAHYQLTAEDALHALRVCGDTCAAQGDLEYAGYARAEHDGLLVLTEGAAPHVTQRLAHTISWAIDFQVSPCIRTSALTHAFVEALSEGASDRMSEPPSAEPRSAWASGLILTRQVLLGDYEAAVLSYEGYRAHRDELDGTLGSTLFAFFAAVALTRAPGGESEAREAQRHEASELVARHARMNPNATGPYLDLLSAISAGPIDVAAQTALLDAVFERARAYRLPVLAALSCALASEILAARGHVRLAHSFAEDALRAFSDLSLHAVARSLSRRFSTQGVRTATSALAQLNHGTFLADAHTLDVWSVVKASQILASELHVAPLISRLLQIACESAGAQRAVLVTRVGERLEVAADLDGALEILRHEPLEGNERVPARLLTEAFQKIEPLVIHDVAQDPKWRGLDYFQRANVRSLLCMPVQRGDERLGLLYLENALTVGAFAKNRIEVLRILASQAAVSLENARLLREEAEKQKLLRELEAAAAIQRALVPAEPTLRGAEVCAYMSPADRVGGDYYDVIRADAQEWFVMADVCGHGLAAGLIMIMCQTALHSVLKGQPEIDPAQALVQVNRLLKANLERFGSSTYVAMTLFRYQTGGVVEHAGLHEDILIYRRATRSVEVRATNGTWLGVLDDLTPLLMVERFQLEPGDVLLLYTDGLTDACASDNSSRWGRAALENLLQATGTLPLVTIRARILSALEGYRCADDVTLFLLRR